VDTGPNFDPYGNQPLHPMALAAIIILGAWMLVAKRRHALLPMIIMACFISQAQRIVILGANFNLIRVMVLFGWARVMTRGEFKGFRWVLLDRLIIAWAVARTVIYTIQWGDTSALVYQLGQSFDAIGMYFLFRFLISSFEDFEPVVLGFIVVSLPVAVFFMLELSTGRNVFSYLGGVPLITTVREGKLRCQGPFPHAIMAGCFWAVLLPFVIAYFWSSRRAKIWSVIGCITFAAIVIASWSSTPMGAVIEVIVGFCFFRFRRRMRQIRWSILIVLLILHFFIMKGPVWSLLSHIDLAGGSTGEYRAELISLAVDNVSGWWLVGTKSISSWNPYYYDITDQYIMEGITGGLLTLILFVCMISYGFRGAGRIIKRAKSRREEIMAWAIGVGLFVHMMTFLGASYFGQIIMTWYLQLAVIGSLEVFSERRLGRSSPSILPKAREAGSPVRSSSSAPSEVSI